MRYPFSLFILFTLSILAQKDNLLCAQSASNFGNEVIYHVVQRSFYDSNGDLHGDLNGLRQKLPYLQELGVTSILLLPLYHSEFYHNYFATSFEQIDPEFGTLDDYVTLVQEVHRHGMKLYMDMETQYVTEDHVWYTDSYQNPASPYSHYLIYNGPNNTKPESIIFDLTELTGYDGTVRKITTVNMLNPDVLAYNKDLFSYWVDPNGDGNFDDGVDGFRLDHMMDDLDWKGKFTGLFAKFWTPLITHLNMQNPKLIFIAEQANWESYGNEFLEQGNVDRVFAFNLLNAFTSFTKENISDVMTKTFSGVHDNNTQIVFLENHDINRFASGAAHNVDKLKVAAVLNLLIGGTPLIYYGQEIGMTGIGGFGMFGNTDANDIPRREAFEWYRIPEGTGMATWYKDSGPWWNKSHLVANDGISLEEQQYDPQSLWNTYRTLLELRKSHPVLVSGTYRELTNNTPHVFSFVRENDQQKILVVLNLSEDENSISLTHDKIGLQVSRARVLAGNSMIHFGMTNLDVTMPGYGYLVVEVE